ncbi:MAG: metallophosphoesterase [Treponema sp.]|nr:metallophosphoesterase [Treponema sp.]
MKILCVSDYVDPLIYNQNVKQVFSDVDLVLCAGDLPLDYVDFIVTMLNKPTYFVFGNHNLNDFSHYHKSASFVPSEVQQARDAYYGHGGTYAGFKVLKDNSLAYTDPKTGKRTPLLIAGVSGSLMYNKGLNQYTERQMKLRLLMMVPALIRNKIRYGRYLDILLTHASPRHIHDKEDPCHKGFECFNWFIQKFKPSLMVHGHIHLYDARENRITKSGDTTILNAYAHWLIEYP